MKLALIGATGPTGSQALTAALDHGHLAEQRGVFTFTLRTDGRKVDGLPPGRGWDRRPEQH